MPDKNDADLLAGRGRALLEQLGRGDQHSRRAVAALQCVALDECLLQVGDLPAVGDALDRDHLGAVGLHRQHQAAAHDRAVDPHRAGAADAVLAPDMRAGEAELGAQEIDQVLSDGNVAA